MEYSERLAVHHRRSALSFNSPIFHPVKGDRHFRYRFQPSGRNTSQKYARDLSDKVVFQIINPKGIEIHQATGNILLIGSYSVPHQSLDSTHLRACLDCVLPQRRNDSETSTIVKQMEIIHQNGSAHEGLLAFRSFIW
ncbi:hypothetical protein B0F90DRAFT_1751522 [Multifurca ochricompacta]|uniref:Uncharacterized protein n=1 Tax=Multifurca ochricompacta TaxID=376703 RepID=A0AAD4LYU4_9AGAM|nr:hypothetical protein B0F90DRAFT_1751522 [Multifurca ochricompacta]